MDRVQPGPADSKRPIFVSRAGEDEAISERIVDILEAAGYEEVIVQQRDFPQRNFMDCMNEALERDARVVALLSNDYLRWRSTAGTATRPTLGSSPRPRT